MRKLIIVTAVLPILAFSAHSSESTHSRTQSNGKATPVGGMTQRDFVGSHIFCGQPTERNDEMGTQTVTSKGAKNVVIRPTEDGSYEMVPYSEVPSDCRDSFRKDPNGQYVVNPDDGWKSLGTNFTRQCLDDIDGAQCATVFFDKNGKPKGQLAASRIERGEKHYTALKGSHIGKTGLRSLLRYWSVVDPEWGSLVWVAYPPCEGEVKVAKHFLRGISFDGGSSDSNETQVADADSEKEEKEETTTASTEEKPAKKVAKKKIEPKQVKAKEANVVPMIASPSRSTKTEVIQGLTTPTKKRSVANQDKKSGSGRTKVDTATLESEDIALDCVNGICKPK